MLIFIRAERIKYIYIYTFFFQSVREQTSRKNHATSQSCLVDLLGDSVRTCSYDIQGLIMVIQQDSPFKKKVRNSEQSAGNSSQGKNEEHSQGPNGTQGTQKQPCRSDSARQKGEQSVSGPLLMHFFWLLNVQAK